MFAERERTASPVLWLGLLVVYLVATRWPLAPKYLYYFDSANFALALDRFNPALHQPQPPGYPLFVALTRMIHVIVPKPETVFLIAGLLGAVIAVTLIAVLGQHMFGRNAGFLAAVLLATDPVFWFGGITNQVRVFLAVSALAVALLGWRAICEPERPAWLYATFVALAIGGGFRPVCAALLTPLAIWVWWRNGARPLRLAVGLTAGAVAALPWVAATIIATGGPAAYMQCLRDYSVSQFQGSSALFGAESPSAWRMFQSALVWSLLGTLAWIWAIPFVRSAPDDAGRPRAAFLAVALAPPLLFSAIVHIGDPDQALASVAIVSLIGGATLAKWAGGGRRLAGVALAVAAVHTIVFFRPPTRLAKAASYRAVAAVDRMTRGAIESIQALRGEHPLTIVHYGSSVASRQLAYYFPDDYVVILPSPGASGETPQVYFHRQPISDVPALHPASTRVVCLLPWNSKGAELQGWLRQNAVFVRDRAPEAPVRIGRYELLQATL